MKKHPTIIGEGIVDRTTIDPHHDGLIEWGWIVKTQQLYCRYSLRKKKGFTPWRIVNRIHITPKRLEIINNLVNSP